MSYSPPDAGFFDTIQIYFLELTGRAVLFSGRDMELLCQWREQGATAALICRGIQQAVASMQEGQSPRGIHGCQRWVEEELAHSRERAAGGHTDEPAVGHAPVGPQESPRPAGDSAPHMTPHTIPNTTPGTVATSAAPPAQSAQPGQPLQVASAESTAQSEPMNPYQDFLEDILARIQSAGQACTEDPLRKVYRDAWRATRELLRQHSLHDPYSALASIEDALADGYFRALDQRQQAQIAEALAEENRAALAMMSPDARREHLAARRRSLLVREHGLMRLLD